MEAWRLRTAHDALRTGTCSGRQARGIRWELSCCAQWVPPAPQVHRRVGPAPLSGVCRWLPSAPAVSMAGKHVWFVCSGQRRPLRV